MAEFVRGGPGVGMFQKEKLHGSPSTGSDEGHDGAANEDFDPFINDQDEVEGGNDTIVVSPPETQ